VCRTCGHQSPISFAVSPPGSGQSPGELYVYRLRGDHPVFLRGDAALEFRSVAQVIDTAGLTRVALMTER
jgi:hypothetical protein